MRILFVCTGNTCRSPMAEGLAKKRFSKHPGFTFSSCGTFALGGSGASANAISAMKEFGVDISDHRSSNFNELSDEFDLILTMTRAHKSALSGFSNVYSIKEYVLGKNDDVCDPFGGNLEEYKACANELEALIDKLYEVLIKK